MLKKLLKKEYDIVAFLCSLLIPLLVTGPFLPDLIVSALSVWFVVLIFKKKQFFLLKNSFFLYFCFFWLICVTSSLFSDNVLISLKSSLFFIRIGLFALLIGYLINQKTKILVYFYYSFLITFSVIILDGFYQHFSGVNLLGYKLQGLRVSSFFGDELILGSYLVRLLPLFLAISFLAYKNNSNFNGIYIFILITCTSLLIYISGERSSLAFLIMILFYIVFLGRNIKLYFSGIIFITLLLVALLTINDKRNFSFYDRFVGSTIDELKLNNEKVPKYFFTRYHDSVFRTAVKMFLDKPILGHGPKMFRYKCSNPKYSVGYQPCQTHPHNFYIQLLSETGILGFLCLFIFFIYFIFINLREFYYRYKKDIKNQFSNYKILLLSGLLITIWPISTNGSIFTNHLMIFYSLQMGFFFKKDNSFI